MIGLGVSCRRLAILARRWWLVWLPLCFLLLAFAVWQGIEFWGVGEFRDGQRAFQGGRLNDAQEHLSHYLESHPGNAEAHLLAARVDRLLGHYSGAEKHLNECQRLGGMTGDIQVENFL